MSYAGSLPQGQSPFAGQQQNPQQPQQQQGHPQHHQHPHAQYAPQPGYHGQQQQQQQQFMQQNQQIPYGYPSQQLSYDYGNFGQMQQAPQARQQQQQQLHQPQQQVQPQAQPHMIHGQEQFRMYNNGSGYGGDRGMQMPGAEQYMPSANVWQQQQQQHVQRHPQMVPQAHQQQGYHVPSPQMAHGMTQAQMYHQGQPQQQQAAHQQAAQQQQMRHLQQAPRRSPSMSQMHNQHAQQAHPSPSHHPQSLQQMQAQAQAQGQPQPRPSPSMPQQQHPQQQFSPAQTQSPLQQQQQWHPPQHHARPQQQAYRSPSISQQHQPRPSPSMPQQPDPTVAQKKKKKPQAAQQTQPQQSQQQQQQHQPPHSQPPQPQAHPQPQIQPQPSPQTQTQTSTPTQISTPTPTQPQHQHQPKAEPDSQPQTTPKVATNAPEQRQEQQQISHHEPMQFVNLQDIQRMPMSMSMPMSSPFTMGNTQSNADSSKQSPLQPAPVIKQSPSSTPRMSNIPSVKSERQKGEPSPKTSASQSPAGSVGRISSKSPAIANKTSPFNTPAVMVSMAEEFIEKARAAAPSIAATLQADQVDEYQRMIGTGMACLEGALQSQRLTPRQEARVRLRYAAVLQEETENIMEAETTLSKGITLCDKHRMLELKYCMQYMMMKALFRRNRKAASKALDQHISDCDAYQHAHWGYAFRLLKASFYVETGTSADAPALDNMRSIYNMAAGRGDSAMCVYASLSEALILLQTSKGTPEMIQSALAQASKYQLEPQTKIPQLELLNLLVDYLSSLNREKQDAVAERLRRLQKKIDECQNLATKADFLLPVRKQPAAAQTIGADVSTIIQPGNDSEESDYLVMSFVTQMELMVLVFTMGGLTYLHKPASAKSSSADLWRQGLKIIGYWQNTKSAFMGAPALSLTAVTRQIEWRVDIQCYLNLLLGLLAASQCQWEAVKHFLNTAEHVRAPASLQGMLRTFYIYLKGVSCQGVGDFDHALFYYQDESLSLNAAPIKQSQRHLALLAGMNRLWIMQHPAYQNDMVTMELLNELDPLCREHYSIEIRGAWSGVKATVVTNPPRQRNQRKEDAGQALGNARASTNALATTVGLVIARDLLYNNVLGDQAWKCMQAAAHWANKSCNPLWQSVVDGILADFSEARNEKENAKKFWDKGIQDVQLAFGRSS